MGDFVPTKAVTVRLPIEVVQMLEKITDELDATNKEAIERLIREAYNDLFGE